MKSNDFCKFNRMYFNNRNWYISGEKSELKKIISKDEDYSIRFSYRPNDEIAVLFRLEDYKEEILGAKRNGASDNDLTILDDDIYQIEIKGTKGIDHSKVLKQFNNGWEWVRHILWAADSENLCHLKRKYDILIHLKIVNSKRTARNLSRKPVLQWRRNEDCSYTVVNWYVPKGAKLHCPLNNVIEIALHNDKYTII